MAIKLITDSTIDLPESSEVIVAPLTVMFGEKEYLDTVDITKDEFYDLLETSDVLPKTSQVTPARFMELYDEITANNDEAVVITISSKLSGTFQSALLASKEYSNIRVVDSENVTIGSGVLALEALKCINKGWNLETIYNHLESSKKRIRLLAALDTLEYLQKGGRISKTTAIAGGLLNIKPIITSVDGELKLVGKARGNKKAGAFLRQMSVDMPVDYNFPVLPGFTGKNDDLLSDFMKDSGEYFKGLDSLNRTQLGSIIGTHAGPNAFAIAYFEKGE